MPRPLALRRPGAGVLLGGAIAVALAAVAFVARGGQTVDQATWPEIALLLGGAALGVLALVRVAAGQRGSGLPALGAMAALVVLTSLSISWAVQPDDALAETSRMLAYLAVFGGGIALARLASERWESLLIGVLIACVAVAGYAALSKVLPDSLSADEYYARLRAPFGYWNATGLIAALGVPACLWLAGRRRGHAAINALAYPALGLLLVVVVLSYSRGALLALVIGLVLWFATSQRRLRAAAALLCGIAGAAAVCGWALGRAALTQNGVDLGLRLRDGHRLGALLVLVLLALLGVGLAVGFRADRRRLGQVARERIGIALILVVVLAPVGGLLALHASAGGISGQWHRLTDINSRQPPNAPSRLTALGSVRARYFDEAVKVSRPHTWRGVGAGGFATARQRISRDQFLVRHAHSYFFQTLADLGVIGLAVNAVLLALWAGAALRTLKLRRPGRLRADPERAGLLTLAAIVLVFGVHSLIDWTWFVPGTAVPALLCAGWLAGRGPLGGAPARRVWSWDPFRLAGAFALLATTLVAAWTVLQPLRAQHSVNAALAAAADGHPAVALAAARRAVREDALSADPLFALGLAQTVSGHPAAARAAYQRAVALQPANPATWRRLGSYELTSARNPVQAERALAGALYLAPHDPAALELFLQAHQAREAK